MKKAIAAAFALSLLAGTSALAQEAHQRGDGDWRARAAQRHEHQQQQADRQDRRDADRMNRQDGERAVRPTRPVPQVSNERAQEAIAAARARQTQHDAIVIQRRNDRANDVVRRGRMERNEEQQVFIRGPRPDDHRTRAEDRQRHVVPRVTPQEERRRYDRRDNDEQRVYIRPGVRTDSTAARRAEIERRLRDRDQNWNRNRDRGHDQNWDRDRDRDHGDRYRRPGEGHQLRDRDRNRHWYNPDQWRRSYWAQHRYRAPRYRYPSGWYVRSWIFGDYLPHGWYSQNYYLDWWRYGLPMPPIGAEWVRVGDDALLVDSWSGEVLSAYYDLFW